MEKSLYPTYPVKCIITGPSNVGKSVILTILVLDTFNEYERKVYLLTKSTSSFISKVN